MHIAQGLSLGMEERAMIMAGPETRPLMARWVGGWAKPKLKQSLLFHPQASTARPFFVR